MVPKREGGKLRKDDGREELRSTGQRRGHIPNRYIRMVKQGKRTKEKMRRKVRSRELKEINNERKETEPSTEVYSSEANLLEQAKSQNQKVGDILCSEDLQPLKIDTQITWAKISTSMPPLIHATPKICRPTGINPNPNSLILNPPEEPRNLPQLLPSTNLVLIPHPQRIPNPFDLDTEIRAPRMVLRE